MQFNQLQIERNKHKTHALTSHVIHAIHSHLPCTTVQLHMLHGL